MRALAPLVLAAAGCITFDGPGGDGDGDGSGPDAAPPDACEPVTCLDIGYSCGPADDGCGGTLDCGGCDAPLSCGAEEHVCICQFATETVETATGSVEIDRGADGVLRIVYETGGVLHHALRSAGGSWVREAVPEAGTIGSRLRAAIDASSAVHVVFFDDSRGLVYAQRSPAGAWSTEIIAADAEASADLTLDADGGVHVSYTTFDDVLLASRAPGDTAFSVELVRSARPDRGTAIAAGADGTLHIIYLPFFGESILHASRAPGAPDWTVEPVLETRGHGFDLAIDAAGGLHLLYFTGSVFGSVHYASAPAGAAWSTERIGGDVGSAALAVTPGGEPHVIWAPPFAGALYLARRSFGDWNEEPLGQHAEAVDIALDGTGLADVALSTDEPAILHAAWPCP